MVCLCGCPHFDLDASVETSAKVGQCPHHPATRRLSPIFICQIKFCHSAWNKEVNIYINIYVHLNVHDMSDTI